MDAFTALVEPNRRLLLDAIRVRPSTVNMLVETAGLSQPAVSKHLKVLRQAKLVTVRPDGQKRWYCLNPAPLQELETYLEPYRQFLNDRLDGLERYLDQMQAP
ncbi:MAG: winged helix-turn-helix transcriptional regulator [Pseudomonadales bacterium]|nr:winged helix-turn-helix transcriptional regulator [Pseudomonadales bacterium]